MANEIKAPMVGKFLSYEVQEGASIKKDDVVAKLEAMKMEVMVFSTADGVAKSLTVTPGANVTPDTVLLTIE